MQTEALNLMGDEQFLPLPEKLRPQSLEEVIGQQHILGEEGFISKCIASNSPTSVIFWGAPGCGKTTIARLYAQAFKAHFEQISAVLSGVADIKRVVAEATSRRQIGQLTVLFVDEIHRFNKSQQDAFLPYVENGTIVLIGATTENPSFELNSALLSRVQVLTLNSFSNDELEELIVRAEASEGKLHISDDARSLLLELAQGDGRYLLSILQSIYSLASFNNKDNNPDANSNDKDSNSPLTSKQLAKLVQKRMANYDKNAEAHYDMASVLHKAIRGSDYNATLYWVSRMLEGGEDPLFIARRLIKMASEDIGLADPQALPLAVSARDAYMALGSPEGDLMLAEVAVYLALAPKSNALYMAFGKARQLAKKTSNFTPPLFARNAPTKLMDELGYGDGYQYDHNSPNAFSGQNYFPDGMERVDFYQPPQRGYERDMNKRIDYFAKLREKLGE